MPKISVIMSVYNGQKYVQEAIQSIIDQTSKDWELIVVNDGSNDESGKIIAEFKDERIIIITNKVNLGLTKSLNLALNQAAGEYIARLDSDDISEAERLEKQLTFMEKHPEIVLVGSGVIRINDQGGKMANEQVATGPLALKYALLLHNPFYHSTIFFRRKEIMAAGGYNEDYRCAQDFELYSRLAKKYQLNNINEPLVRFRVHQESVVAQPESQKIVRKNALKIIFQNINYYTPVSAEDYDRLKELLIIKKSEASTTIKDLIMAATVNRRLWRAFIKKEKLSRTEKEILVPHYQRVRMMIIKRYLLIKKRKWLSQSLKK
ncbi:MAG TPA: glycosyltransferase [bacterium]|nr:glycosyltransferase [bacterium]